MAENPYIQPALSALSTGLIAAGSPRPIGTSPWDPLLQLWSQVPERAQEAQFNQARMRQWEAEEERERQKAEREKRATEAVLGYLDPKTTGQSGQAGFTGNYPAGSMLDPNLPTSGMFGAQAAPGGLTEMGGPGTTAAFGGSGRPPTGYEGQMIRPANEVAANPMVRPAGAMAGLPGDPGLWRAMAANDPFGTLEKIADYRIKQAEPDQADSFTLGPGQVRYGPGGREIARGPDKPKERKRLTRDVPLEGGKIQDQESYDGGLTWTDIGKPYERKPGVEVQVGSPEIGTIPQGYEAIRGEEGWTLRPIRGGPAEAEIEKEKEQAKSREEQAKRYSDVVTADVDRAISKIESADIPITGFGSLLSAVPGSTARDVAGLIDTIRANVGFDRLQQMRNASPTGGALGQVSELENRLLQATLGNLEQSQSQEQLIYNLKRVKQVYLDIIHGPGNRPGKKGVAKVPSEMTDEELIEELSK